MLGVETLIETITLKNFQTHSKLRVEFDENVTTIIGPSDHGKSAILRAIRWVCLNQPAGNAFLKHGEKNVSVDLIIDGAKLTRAFEGGENVYKLAEIISKGKWKRTKQYKAFGREVPKPIAGFLKSSSLNFQGQHDAPFWFSETAGEVSRQLNQIVNLDLIDKTLSALGSKLRHVRSVVTEREERVDETREKHRQYRGSARLIKDYDQLKAAAAISAVKRRQTVALASFVSDVSVVKKRLEDTGGAILASQIVKELGDDFEEKTERVERLSAIVDEIENSHDMASEIVPNIQPLAIVGGFVVKKCRQVERLQELIRVGEEDVMTITDCEQLKEESERLRDKLSKGRCPLCKQKLPK